MLLYVFYVYSKYLMAEIIMSREYLYGMEIHICVMI